ncbi:MAG: carboxypeptidase-like regulatory domain-containing protein [Acidobacteriia bacterium]|nr:carboxypeptidase-like regulatory domain-containing protein [Terriglobia bacterium]
MDAAFTRRLITVLAITVVILSLLSTAALADELYARVRGTVTDSSGAVVPGVAMKITNPATGFSRTTTSSGDGTFEFINLIPGTYAISATKAGYATTTVGDIKLLANQTFVSTVSLKVGAVTEEVTVIANPAQVEQTSIQLTATISEKTITDLPLNGRNWVTLQQTLPGVVLPDTRFGTNYSTNGSQAQQNSYLINGSDSNDLPLNSPLAPPNPDAISEVRMITNTINPEYGRNSGAIMNAITKSGTNSFHGTAFEFFRDTSLNTKNYFQLHPAKFHQHQYGGTVGGPIIKNKTFFFFSLQNTRNVVPSTQQTGITTVYTPAQLTGNFSAISCTKSGVRGTGAFCLDPAKTTPFAIGGFPAGTPWINVLAGGSTASGAPVQVPGGAASFNAQAASLVKQFVPLPNLGTNQFTFNPSLAGRTNQYIGRLDQNVGSKDAFWFYAYANNNASVDDLPFTASTLPGFGQKSSAFTKQFTASWSRTLSSSMLNELRLGYTRLYFQAVFPIAPVQPKDVGFTNIFPQLPSGAGYPAMTITGYFGLGFSTNGPQPRKDQTYQLTDNFSWVRGRHSIKVGYEGRKFQVWNPFSARNSGSFTFNNSATFGTGDPGLNFLLGIPTGYNQGSGSLIIAQAYEHYAYVQDQWRMRDNLTLTFGTGYQIDQPIQELQNNGINRVCIIAGQQSKVFPTAPVAYNFNGDPGCNKGGGATTKYNHFGPRVGFAYSPNWGRISGGPGKMSIRGGIGLYYNRGEEELNLQDLGNPPLGLTSTGVGDLHLAPSFPDPWKNIATGVSITNKFPFVPPAPGSVIDFTAFEPFFINVFDPKSTIPRAANYNLTVERELPGQTIMRVAYVGSMARHLVASYSFNSATPAGVADCLTNPACFNDPENAPGNFPSHYPFDPNIFAQSGMQHTNANSIYNSLQVTVDKHLSHGLQVLGTYTWAHAMDQGSSFEDIAFLANGGSDPYGNLKRDYGDSAFDTRHRFTVSSSYDVPNLNKLSMFSWMPSRVMGGWRLTGIYAWQTGQPIIFQDNSDNSLTCAGNYTFYACPDRPDVVFKPKALDPHTAVFGTLNHYFFDPGAFEPNALGTLGTTRRGFLHGPSYANIDFALQKDTKVTEGTTIQLRLEAFNLFNHTNFANPTGNSSSANFGRVTSIRTNTNSRLVQLGAKFIF